MVEQSKFSEKSVGHRAGACADGFDRTIQEQIDSDLGGPGLLNMSRDAFKRSLFQSSTKRCWKIGHLIHDVIESHPFTASAPCELAEEPFGKIFLQIVNSS
jgi:hypothetical protein